MNYINKIIILIVFILATSCSNQESTYSKSKFVVNGHCDMCKNSMEKPLTKDVGVLDRNWDVDSKIMSITYDSLKISLQEIKTLIKETGYTTEEISE